MSRRYSSFSLGIYSTVILINFLPESLIRAFRIELNLICLAIYGIALAYSILTFTSLERNTRRRFWHLTKAIIPVLHIIIFIGVLIYNTP